MDTSSLNNNSIVVYGLLSGRHFGEIEYDFSDDTMIYTSSSSFASGERIVHLVKELITKERIDDE